MNLLKDNSQAIIEDVFDVFRKYELKPDQCVEVSMLVFASLCRVFGYGDKKRDSILEKLESRRNN